MKAINAAIAFITMLLCVHIFAFLASSAVSLANSTKLFSSHDLSSFFIISVSFIAKPPAEYADTPEFLSALLNLCFFCSPIYNFSHSLFLPFSFLLDYKPHCIDLIDSFYIQYMTLSSQ